MTHFDGPPSDIMESSRFRSHRLRMLYSQETTLTGLLEHAAHHLSSGLVICIIFTSPQSAAIASNRESKNEDWTSPLDYGDFLSPCVYPSLNISLPSISHFSHYKHVLVSLMLKKILSSTSSAFPAIVPPLPFPSAPKINDHAVCNQCPLLQL